MIDETKLDVTTEAIQNGQRFYSCGGSQWGKIVVCERTKGGWDVEVAWQVPEAHGDDAMSRGGLLGGVPEVGWVASYDSAEDAALAYETARAQLWPPPGEWARSPGPDMPAHGRRTGNVDRP